MAILDKDNRNILIGIAVGVAAAGAVKAFGPAFKGVGRPLAKGVVRSGIKIYDVSREFVAQAAEMIEDLVAEVRSEVEEHPTQIAEGIADIAEEENGSVQ
jgi:hypothetical protein